MEEPRKKWSGQERKKMAVNIGGGGGGIGTVVLLGGALATAALASAFIVRKKGRSSGKEGSRRRRQSQDSQPEIKKQNKEDEENKGEKIIFPDHPSHVHKHLSGGEKKEVEQDNDNGLLVYTESVKLDEKPRDESNGGRQSDVDDDDFVMIKDEKSSFEPQIMMQEDEVKIELTKEDVSNEISEESKNIAKVDNEEERAEGPSDDGEIKGTNGEEAIEITEVCYDQEEAIEITEVCYDQEEEIDLTAEDSVLERVDNDRKEAQKNVNMEVNVGEREVEGFCSYNGEINKGKCEEVIGKTQGGLAAIGSESCHNGICSNQEVSISETSEIIVSGSHGDDGEVLLPVLESRVIEEKNVNGDEKEGVLATEVMEIIQADEVKCIEKLVEEQEKSDKTDGIVPENGVEEGRTGEGNRSNTQSSLQIEAGEKKIDSESNEDDASIGNPTLENGQFGVPMLEEDVISHEVTKECGADADKIANSLAVNDDKISVVAESLEVNNDKISIVAESVELNEAKISIVAESLEVEDNRRPKDKEDDSKENNAKEVEEELIFPEDISVTNELNNKKISTQSADNCQPKDCEDDIERNIANKVEEEVISPENIEVMKKDGEKEEVGQSVEVQGNTSVQEQENGAERNIGKELEDSSETIDEDIAKAEDDMITEMSEDEQKGEANLSDEIEESSVGTGDSSAESNSEAIWPAESLQETSMEPQKKLIDQEMGGKIQEDKTVKESEENSHDSSLKPYQVNAEERESRKISANLPYENGASAKTFVNKYAVNSTRWKVLIGAVSVVSSLSCSWFFGLSFVKPCLLVFLTMALSKIYGYRT